MDPATYTASHPFNTGHFAEPARIAIPPPELHYLEGEATLTVENSLPFEYGSAKYGSPTFLKSIISYGPLHLPHSILAWKYEMRRNVQPILPFLLLGPSSVARDVNFVRDNGITMLIAVRSATAVKTHPQLLNPALFPSAAGIDHLTVDLDSPYEMRTNLPQTIKAMNDHLERSCTRSPITRFDDIRGKILIFCESGIERSPTLVAGYLMTVLGIGLIPAMQMIQSQRFCISPDDGMKEMLVDWNDYLRAERQVAMQKYTGIGWSQQSTATKTAGEVLNKSNKRNIDRAYESDEDTMDEDRMTEKEGGSKGRAGVAPFADVRE